MSSKRRGDAKDTAVESLSSAPSVPAVANVPLPGEIGFMEGLRVGAQSQFFTTLIRYLVSGSDQPVANVGVEALWNAFRGSSQYQLAVLLSRVLAALGASSTLVSPPVLHSLITVLPDAFLLVRKFRDGDLTQADFAAALLRLFADEAVTIAFLVVLLRVAPSLGVAVIAVIANVAPGPFSDIFSMVYLPCS
eukprot:TRINITY_DN1910_c0_g1_i1.p1 TRINITY_DN1910_c0_g1~~TRINITY_DN1910_c0_g1_i1.p1  ORF type:complete len:192 (+),score=17.09 TRINITY_DN1910_c0_g1_i1:101-676(+)